MYNNIQLKSVTLPPIVIHFSTTVSPSMYGPTADPGMTSLPVSSIIFGCLGGTKKEKDI